mmetsp:Transcript_34958/g.36367  ORF Transcript_34958/g.36367 Transcript_34958/m.36367 type:complete len:102 (+) Transcript_34958:2-307(+)
MVSRSAVLSSIKNCENIVVLNKEGEKIRLEEAITRNTFVCYCRLAYFSTSKLMQENEELVKSSHYIIVGEGKSDGDKVFVDYEDSFKKNVNIDKEVWQGTF